VTEDFSSQLRQSLDAYQPETIEIAGFRKAAVLVPLLQTEAGIEILFTVRSSALKHHAGQISFPGGRLDEGENLVEAAVRETFEETGLSVSAEGILGFLDEHPSPAQFVVTPVVAILPWPQVLQLNHGEVESVFTAPLAELLALIPTSEERQLKQYRRKLYFYQYKDRLIWGLTGNVLKKLLDVVRGLEKVDRGRGSSGASLTPNS
jgi:8-oxo-dGTP pyrophosphatase MutT (NUDIX family)